MASASPLLLTAEEGRGCRRLMRQVTFDDLEDVAPGATVLGTGGGDQSSAHWWRGRCSIASPATLLAQCRVGRTETRRDGYRVVVLGVSDDRRWRTPARLDIVGPASFGDDAPFVPIDVRVQPVRAA